MNRKTIAKFHRSIYTHQHAMVEAFLRKDLTMIHAPDVKDHLMPLTVAVKARDAAMVKLLLRFNPNRDLFSAVKEAIIQNHSEILFQLLTEIPVDQLESLLVDQNLHRIYETALGVAIRYHRFHFLDPLYLVFVRLKTPVSKYLNSLYLDWERLLFQGMIVVKQQVDPLAYQILIWLIQHDALNRETKVVAEDTSLKRLKYLGRAYPSLPKSYIRLLAACVGDEINHHQLNLSSEEIQGLRYQVYFDRPLLHRLLHEV